MSSLKNLKTIVHDTSITIYWDKPKNLPKEYKYEIYNQGKKEGITLKTHYTLEDLVANTEYEMEIKLVDELKKEIIESEKVIVSTCKVKRRIDITKSPYFAVGDGNTINTKAIQQALDDCNKDSYVYIPEGIFMTGALRMYSNTELYIDENGVLQGTDRVEDYLPRIKSRFEGLEMECYSSLINMGELDHTAGCNCENIIIRGKGTISSGGRSLAGNVIESERIRLQDYIASLGEEIKTYENADTIPGRVRPRLVNISNTKNVVIEGITLKNGASWNVHMIYSDNVITHNCKFYSHNVWNGDGWDPDSSINCTIFNCVFDTGDDSVAIKSGKNPEGNIINRPCENIRIFDCTSLCGHGFTMGSEMSGGIKNIYIWDCDVSNSMYGIEIKGTKKRGGYIKNIYVRDTKVARIMMHSVGYNDDGVGAESAPIFSDCIFENVYIEGEYLGDGDIKYPCESIELCGFDEKGYNIRNIRFKDITLGKSNVDKQNISIRYCENITFENIQSI